MMSWKGLGWIFGILVFRSCTVFRLCIASGMNMLLSMYGICGYAPYRTSGNRWGDMWHKHASFMCYV